MMIFFIKVVNLDADQVKSLIET